MTTSRSPGAIGPTIRGYFLLLLLFSSCIPSQNLWDKHKIRGYAKHADEIRVLADFSIKYSSHSKWGQFSIDTIPDKALKRRFYKVGLSGTVEVRDSTVTFSRLYLRGLIDVVYVFSKTSWDSTTHREYIKVADNLYYLHGDFPLM